MKNMTKYGYFLFGIFFFLGAQAQLPSNRVRPGTMFNAGDTVHSPRLGLRSVIPAGWEGVLPRGTEVFLLMPVSNVNGEIYATVNQDFDQQSQIKRWKEGMDFGEGLRLIPTGAITTRGDVLCTRATLTGPDANNATQIYLEAKCSPFGFCIVYMLNTDKMSFESVKTSLQSLVDQTTFSKPTTESPYVNFNWKKFLSNKTLLMIDYEQTSKKEDEVNLCGDGTFSSQITRKGLFKDQAKQYQGYKKGTWTVTNNGEKANLTFTIEKLPSITLTMEARDEEIYINGNRYFVGSSEKCK